MSRLRELIEIVARALADHPQAVSVAEFQHRGTQLIELSVAPGDVGKMIGRQGRTIAAMRTLVATAAERAGAKAMLEIRESSSA